MSITSTTPADYVVNLTPTGVVAGTYGSTHNTPVVTVDTYGRITNCTNSTLPPLIYSLDTGQSIPTWTWVSGGTVAPTAINLTWSRVGNRLTCYFQVSPVWTTLTDAEATITLPQSILGTFSGTPTELIGVVTIRYGPSAGTPWRQATIKSKSGTNNLASIIFSGATMVVAGVTSQVNASFIYGNVPGPD